MQLRCQLDKDPTYVFRFKCPYKSYQTPWDMNSCLYTSVVFDLNKHMLEVRTYTLL